MKIEKTILRRINKSQKVRKQLSAELAKDLRTINSAAQKNEDEGLLTTVLAVKVISQYLSVSTNEVLVSE